MGTQFLMGSNDDNTTRQWDELLQELRVTQTGVQILTGFLLTVPFSNRFTRLDEVQKGTYLAVLVCSVIATALIVAPVAFHRTLFHRHRRVWLVAAAHRCARVGLLAMALASCGVVFLVFDLVTQRVTAIAVGCGLLASFVAIWFGIPVLLGEPHSGEREGTDR